MTLLLIDIASWQTTEKRPSDPLDLSVAKSRGYDLVNIKIGQGDWYSWRTWMGAYADKARDLNMGVCTFHWLDNTASGAAQARIAYERMKRLGQGSADGIAHQCDCEDTEGRPATFTIWRDYVNAMQDLLGRPVVNYTGDWWWQPRGWTGGNVTPYLWAAPNAGYLGSYPGDDSRHWHAGYGGWDDYAVLQYAVSPISGAGGGNISKSAIRDPKVWAALIGQTKTEEDPFEMAMNQETFTQWFQDALSDPEVEAMMKARGWQYKGGGIPEGMSTLSVLNSLYNTAQALKDGQAAMTAAVGQLQAAVTDLYALQQQTPVVDPAAVAQALIDKLKAA